MKILLGPNCLTCIVMMATLASAAGDTRLAGAAKLRDLAAVRSLLEQRVEVNAAQADGGTALMWAAHWGELEMARLLIQARADVKARNAYGATALWLASNNGHAAIVEMLLQAGADPNATLSSGETALIAAAGRSPDVVKALLARGAAAEAREPQGGQTALMRAAAEKRPDVVRVLIEFGRADVNARSNGGFTPLLFAAQQNDKETAQILLGAGADVNAASPDTTPLLLAASRGYQAVALLLLEAGADPKAVDSNGHTALHYAASRRSMLETVEPLLARGADANARVWKDTAVTERVPIIAVSFMEGKPSRVIKAGTPGGTIPVGATPFWMATRGSNIKAMRLLANRGADPFLALTETVYLDGGSGRRVNYIAGTTPLMHVAGVGRILGNWHDYDAEEMAFALEAVKMLVEMGADVSETNDYGFTALHGAAHIGADPIIEFLVSKGAKLDVMDRLGQTPLSIAQHVITAQLGDNFDARPRRYRETTSALLLKSGAAPLAASGVQVQSELRSTSQLDE